MTDRFLHLLLVFFLGWFARGVTSFLPDGARLSINGLVVLASVGFFAYLAVRGLMSRANDPRETT